MSLGGGWMRDEFPEKYVCDSFHPYTTTWLCKACNGPPQVHKSFMKAHNEKMAKKEKEKVKGEYEAKRKKLIELSGTEIDAPEEMVDVGGVRMPVSLLEKLREAFANPSSADRKYSGGMKRL